MGTISSFLFFRTCISKYVLDKTSPHPEYMLYLAKKVKLVSPFFPHKYPPCLLFSTLVKGITNSIITKYKVCFYSLLDFLINNSSHIACMYQVAVWYTRLRGWEEKQNLSLFASQGCKENASLLLSARFLWKALISFLIDYYYVF